MKPPPPPRRCATCNARGVPERATFVARNADDEEWFECSEHQPNDNESGLPRVARVPIGEWFARLR